MYRRYHHVEHPPGLGGHPRKVGPGLPRILLLTNLLLHYTGRCAGKVATGAAQASLERKERLKGTTHLSKGEGRVIPEVLLGWQEEGLGRSRSLRRGASREIKPGGS